MNALEISARRDDSGGPVVSAVRPAPQSFQLTTSRLLILIHGYNNTLYAARSSYETFLNNSNLGGLSPAGQACAFFWPGDKDWSWFSFLSYPLEIEPAKDSAAVLHSFLKALRPPGGWPLEIALVCHSLGNRVALELISRLLTDQAAPRLRYRAGCYMAAAVPVPMVEDPAGLRPAALAAEHTLVLFSESDGVLHGAFPEGETGAGEGFFPVAVGRFGDPGGHFWSSTGDMGAYGYGHSDYWEGTESANSAASFLGLAPPRMVSGSAIPNRDLPQSRAIPPRAISARSLASRELSATASV